MQWSSSVEVNMFLNATTATSFLARFPAKKQVGAQMHRAIYNKLLPRTGWHLIPFPPPQRLGSLSNDVFERCTSTGSCPFSFLGDGFAQIFSQIVSIRVKKLSNTNYIASRHITREKSSLPVDVRRSKTSLLKLPNNKELTPLSRSLSPRPYNHRTSR